MMCLIIDTNCFSSVFNPHNADHIHFRPILDWVLEGKGKIVFGGTRYLSELSKAPRYLKIFGELKKARKTIEVDKSSVDAHQARIEGFFNPGQHNDPHLPAIVCVSKCAIICTKDSKSHALVKDLRCYLGGVSRPKIYGSRGNRDLLCDANMADICKPATRLNTNQRRSVVAVCSP